MSKYRDALTQLGDRLFLTDGGMETTLIFHQGRQLPEFAAFDLYRQGQHAALADYYAKFLQTARTSGRSP